MGDREVEEMETGLVNGNAESFHTDMDIDDQAVHSLTATQVQDMKVLLSTLSMLSHSVQIPHRLFEKVTAIAQRSEACEVSSFLRPNTSLRFVTSNSRVKFLFHNERLKQRCFGRLVCWQWSFRALEDKWLFQCS